MKEKIAELEKAEKQHKLLEKLAININ